MTPHLLVQILVNLIGVGLIGFIAWFHWGPRKGVKAASTDGRQEVAITVAGGYSPDIVVVDAGRPVRLRFTRKETSSCTERVVFEDFDISRLLPTNEEVVVDLPALEPGEYEFACQMGMIRGKLVAR
ncbi:MAG: cupredoxin domain-containing protein [Deltaproteobacteria bacterium]|nr:MAG: cupredoxin domain-containing protein [Deltaproteobacteria bacterium]